jgi:hypothetical protein
MMWMVTLKLFSCVTAQTPAAKRGRQRQQTAAEVRPRVTVHVEVQSPSPCATAQPPAAERGRERQQAAEKLGQKVTPVHLELDALLLA